MKDPAFLFYSNDFYGGTRMMLPEERACYIDLMIYQHQNGYIPDDTKRVLMFCSGVDEATLKAVLVAKFKLSDKGWYNERLSQVIEKREIYSKERSVSGTIGQFWKKIKNELGSQREYAKVRNKCRHLTHDEYLSFFEEIKNKSITTPKAMLEALLKHIENEIENENEIEDKDIEKGIVKGKNKIAEFEEFRSAYPGNKRGYDVELKVLQKHNDWKAVIANLLPALHNEIDWRKKAKEAGMWTPDWANLQTWLNQRRWEQELKPVEVGSKISDNTAVVATNCHTKGPSREDEIRNIFGKDADPKMYFLNPRTNKYEKLGSS